MRQTHKHRFRAEVNFFLSFLLLFDAAFASPVFVSPFLSEGRFPIRHLKCVSEKTGETGVCMFAFTCARSNGTHLGVCVDGFIYGSCCKIDDVPGIPPQNSNAIDDTNDVPGNVDKNQIYTKRPSSSATPSLVTKAPATTWKLTSNKVTEFTTPKSTESVISKTDDTPSTSQSQHYYRPSTSATTPATSTISTTTAIKSTTKTKYSPKPLTKRPVTPEPTTPSISTIRLSTFQTVQKTTDDDAFTTMATPTFAPKRPTRPNGPDPKPQTQRPRPSSSPSPLIRPSNRRTTTVKPITTSEPSPISIYTLASSTKTPVTHRPFNKRPPASTGNRPKPSKLTSTTSIPSSPSFPTSSFFTLSTTNIFKTSTVSPIASYGQKYSSTTGQTNISSEWTKFPTVNSSPVASTTQRVIPITRFPPRNVTTPPPTTTTDNHLDNLIEDTQMFLNNITLQITRKPAGTRRPVLPSSTAAPLDSLIQISNQLIGNASVVSSTTEGSSSSAVTFIETYTIKPSTQQAFQNVTLEITRKPPSSTRKPVTKKPTKETTKRPPTKRPVVPSRKPQPPPTLETKKPSALPSSTSVTSSTVEFTRHPVSSSSQKVEVTQSTFEPSSPSSSGSKITLSSFATTESTLSNEIVATQSTSTSTKFTQSSSKFPASSSHRPYLPSVPMSKPILTTSVIGGSSPSWSSTTLTKKNTTKITSTTKFPATLAPTATTTPTTTTKIKTSTLPPLILNEIDAEPEKETTLIAVPTTLPPGLVTWSSFPTDRYEQINITRVPEPPLPATTTDNAETEYVPMTPPDGWIIIQSPTTVKYEEVELTEATETAKPVAAKPSSLRPSSSTGKPATESPAPVIFSTSPPKKPIATTSGSLGAANFSTSSFFPSSPSTLLSSDLTSSENTTSTYIEMLSTIATVTVAPEFDGGFNKINMSNFKDVCGRRLFPEPRIVGGDGSTFGKWPWQISLRQWRTSTYLHKCGAALLNENWAITAAHCVQGMSPSDLLLRIGEHDLGSEEEPYGFQDRRVQIVVTHPNFDQRTYEYDLSLMRFHKPLLPFQPNILPVCVPNDDEDYVGDSAYVTGWGRLYEYGPMPSILQEVSVPILNNTVCEGMYRNAGYIEHIPHIFICAGWRKGGFDSCEGDSGGPLVVQRKSDKRWTLVGLISWGIGCAEPNQPGVYTRISEFRDWINHILQY